MNTDHFHRRLESLAHDSLVHDLSNGLKGLEKESMRITAAGRLAHSPHPVQLGSALTHPHITTDYSEALLEFITPPFPDATATLSFLEDIHRFVYQMLPEDELLLATSMPIGFEQDEDIPIARYGSSNIGKMKHIYRVGLAHRYGRTMQAIAGIHFNFSLAEPLWPLLGEVFQLSLSPKDLRAHLYFSLIRNLHRYGWLLLYLFGASPAVNGQFLKCRGGIPEGFVEISSDTYGMPHATSLRMSDIGYKNKTQAGLHISLNSLEEYVTSLCHAIETPHPPYQAIGVKRGGEYLQLNTNILQIENEYYSPVRPKQIAESCEKPTLALKRRGVRYVEIRALDINPFDPLGINQGQIHFLEAFLLFCLLHDSPPITQAENRVIHANLLASAQRGRDPSLDLLLEDRPIPLHLWATEVLQAMEPLCQLMDTSLPIPVYLDSLERQWKKVHDPDETPSARVVKEMKTHGESFDQFAMRLSKTHADYFRSHPLEPSQLEWFMKLARQSLEEQEQIEAKDSLSFDQFLHRYLSQTCQAA